MASVRSLLIAVALLAAAAPAAHARAWKPDVRAARAYADSRPGTIGFSLRVGARVYDHRSAQPSHGASTIKVMLALAYLRRPAVRRRPLGPAERRRLSAMIRRSDDAAASRVHAVVGTLGLQAVARAAGLRDFVASGPVWGASRISARDLALLMWRLDRLTPRRHRAALRRWLRTVVPSQRWGVARAVPERWRLYFKGGWGSGSGAVNHQAALLEGPRGARLALGITTLGNGSHAAGSATLRGVARRLLRGLTR